MTKHTNWKDSKAKQHIQQLFETGKLNPDNLPELKNLYTSRPDLFEAFKLKNFRVNVKNLAKSYREKFAYLSENETETEEESAAMDFESKFYFLFGFLITLMIILITNKN